MPTPALQDISEADPERQGSPAQNDDLSSSDDSNEDDYEDSDDESDEEDDDEEEEVILGPLQRISHALRAKQEQMLANRRHPVFEWKEVARWHANNSAGWAAAEQEQRHREEIAAEKAARRERKSKRKAQRKLTKQKEVEFRTLLEDYTVAIVKSEKRTALITQFAIENRSVEKKRLAVIESAKHAEQLRDAAERIELAEKRDEEEKQVSLNNTCSSVPRLPTKWEGDTVFFQLSTLPLLSHRKSRTRRHHY